MSENIKFEVTNEKAHKIPVKSHNNAKHDVRFEITDNLKHDRVRFKNNSHAIEVPTHNSHKIVPKNTVINLKENPKNISKLLTVNDTKNDFVIQIKNDTKHKRRSDSKHPSTHATLSKAESKSSLRSDHKILIKSDSKSTLRSVESKSDLKSLSGTLPRRESSDTVKGNSLNRTLQKVDSKSTLKSETISTTDAPSSNSTQTKRSLESMTDEEIIEENLKELLEHKNHEERKANGRVVALALAFLVIFIALYNFYLKPWLSDTQKDFHLTGILGPLLIMIAYGGWVALLAKRDKQRQVLFEQHLEEVMERNKIELAKKAKLLKKKKKMEDEQRKANEKVAKQQRLGSHRPSFREKLFGPRTPALQPSTNFLTIAVTAAAPSQIVVESKKNRLERMDALVLPHPPVRTGSAP
ncbi:uncharacterized protein LOC118733986 [Rhagoletis pomonella]|uniref:uncharacterized protein LOC118733986 n=1 Tax=Rhagoletis pomonella TaxID=28610 RepID=UPI0017830624|nr:uncharacterized protein LOC118733986 [Rhagoletis pomonella]